MTTDDFDRVASLVAWHAVARLVLRQRYAYDAWNTALRVCPACWLRPRRTDCPDGVRVIVHEAR